MFFRERLRCRWLIYILINAFVIDNLSRRLVIVVVEEKRRRKIFLLFLFPRFSSNISIVFTCWLLLNSILYKRLCRCQAGRSTQLINYCFVFLFHSIHSNVLIFFLFRKSSCSDLQSRLKVRKMLGVGDTAGSKISQILGHSDHLIFQLPPKLTIWLLLSTVLFSCFTVMVKYQR